MKKITLRFLLGVSLLFTAMVNAQCLTSIEGLYPSATSSATACDGISVTTITTLGYASEYSNVNVTAGETYTFSSNIATDYITISDDDGATAAAFGVTPVTWVAVNDGVVRFYTHLDAACGGVQDFRTRSYVCGIPPCIQPIVSFSTGDLDCLNATFNVTADITDMGSASSITVTDDQGSTPQTILSAGQVSFGPYPFGTNVVLTVTNDQTPICSIISPTETLLGCPPPNDECADAITLSCGDVLTNQTTQGATGGTPTSCLGTIGDDVWYTFTGDGQQITLTATASVEFPQIEVYESTDGTCSGFTPGSCIVSGGVGDSVTTVFFNSVIGTVYYIHIGNYINGDPAILFDLSVTCAEPPTAPANDDCANAVALSCGDTLTDQTTLAATGGTGTSCVGTIGDDVWYTFAGDGEIYTLTATSTNGEGAQVEVYESTDGTCGGFTPGTCFAAAGSGETTTVVTFTSAVGSTYYTHIGSWINGDPAVVFDLSLTCQAPPTAPDNDECSGAYAVTVNPDASCGSVTSGTVFGATPSAVDAVACGGNPDDDVWFSFVASETAHSINLNNVAGSTTDLYHSLWTGDCASLTLVPGSCSDANNSTPTGLTPGETYYIRVYTYTGAALQNSTFDVCVGTLPPAPVNDECGGATSLTVGNSFTAYPSVGTTASALPTSGLTFACQTNRTNDVWYTVDVPASGLLTIETDAAVGTLMTDSVLSVFSGTCGALTEIGCDDDSGNGNFSKVSLTGLTPGDTLYIGVWRYGTGNDGEFQISAYDTTLATSTFENANFAYYPNPVKDVLNLSYSKTITNVAVYNLLGQEVMTKPLNSNLSQVDMSRLSSGTYLVKVSADNQVKTIKVVKQ